MISRVGLSAAAKGGSLARALSSTAISPDSGVGETYSFVKSRLAYRKEVAALRKDFIAEEARRKEKLARDAEAQRLKIMKAKAARLEIKHQQQAIRAKEVAREKAMHDEKVRQYFEEKVEVRKERNAEVERRRETLLATLRQQSAKWTTEQNYAEKLKEDVFIYSPQQISTRNSFDPSSSSGSSAVSWLEKLQRMKPVGVENDEEEEAVASAVAAAADEDEATGSTTEDSSDEEDTPDSTEEETEPTKKE